MPSWPNPIELLIDAYALSRQVVFGSVQALVSLYQRRDEWRCRAGCAYERSEYFWELYSEFHGEFCTWYCGPSLLARILQYFGTKAGQWALFGMVAAVIVMLGYMVCRTGLASHIFETVGRRATMVLQCLRYLWSRLAYRFTRYPEIPNIRRRLDAAVSNAIAASECRNPSIGHTHRSAAYWRNLADMVIDSVAMQMGIPVYDVSPATRNGHRLGQRLFFDAKDLRVPVRWDPVPGHCLISMVDVDYHLSRHDMLRWLTRFMPMIMYTYQPVQITGTEQDVAWHFNDEGHMVAIVTGGEVYTHPIWNWSSAVLTVKDFGTTYTFDVKVYRLHQEVCLNRAIVTLVPASKTPWYLAYPLKGHDIQHYDLKGRYKRLDIMVSQIGMVSNIAVGKSATMIYTELLEAMILRHRLNKLDIAAVQRIMVKEYVPPVEAPVQNNGTSKTAKTDWIEMKLRQMLNPEMTYTRATIVTSWLEGAVEGTKIYLYPHVPGKKTYHYQIADTAELDDITRDYAREITSPLVTDITPVPSRSQGNDKAAIRERVEKVKNDKQPPSTFGQYAREFAQQLIPDAIAGKGVPLEEYQVNERMQEPRQRRRFEYFVRHGLDEPTRVKSFMKLESYPAFIAPRNISTLPTSHIVKVSTYSLPFADYLKGRGETSDGLAIPWYCPGRTPVQIAHMVHSFCAERREILAVDYSKLDGTISHWLRCFECDIYARFFGPTSPIVGMLQSEWNAPAKTAGGLPYNPGYSRLSGSPVTTDGNTVICAFVAYAIQREAGATHADAWSNIGCIYGDDGLLHTSEGNMASKVASTLGLTLKVERISSGPVSFLGRVFLDPWSSPDSIQDPARTVPKMHLTMTGVNVPINVAAVYRARGLLSTDPHTPLLSNYAHFLTRHFSATDSELERFESMCLIDQPFHRNWPTIQPNKRPDALAVMEDKMGVDAQTIERLCSDLDLDVPQEKWQRLEWTTQLKHSVIVSGDIREAGDPKTTDRNLSSTLPKSLLPPKRVTINVTNSPPRPPPATQQPQHGTTQAPTAGPSKGPVRPVPPRIPVPRLFATAPTNGPSAGPKRKRGARTRTAQPSDSGTGQRPAPAPATQECHPVHSGCEPDPQPQQHRGDQLEPSVPPPALETKPVPAPAPEHHEQSTSGSNC